MKENIQENRCIREWKNVWEGKGLKRNLKVILIILAFLIVFALIIMIKISENKNTNSNTVKSTDNAVQIAEKNKNGITEKIVSMSEADRIKAYIGQFLTSIESKKYDEAYSYLNDSFKQNYFQNVDAFKSYAEKKYPTNPKISYESVTRQGEIYVAKVKISDLFNSDFQEFTQRFVIRENSANDFKISFQVE